MEIASDRLELSFRLPEAVLFMTIEGSRRALSIVVRFGFRLLQDFAGASYIIPPIPAPPAGAAGAGSLMLATTDSVVSRVAATLVAF